MCRLSGCNICRLNVGSSGDCDSVSTVYMIECTNCKKVYIGSTTRSIRIRIREHLQNVFDVNCTALSARHFRERCSINSFVFSVLHENIYDLKTLSTLERNEIINRKSFAPMGLNQRSAQTRNLTYKQLNKIATTPDVVTLKSQSTAHKCPQTECNESIEHIPLRSSTESTPKFVNIIITIIMLFTFIVYLTFLKQ